MAIFDYFRDEQLIERSATELQNRSPRERVSLAVGTVALYVYFFSIAYGIVQTSLSWRFAAAHIYGNWLRRHENVYYLAMAVVYVLGLCGLNYIVRLGSAKAASNRRRDAWVLGLSAAVLFHVIVTIAGGVTYIIAYLGWRTVLYMIARTHRELFSLAAGKYMDTIHGVIPLLLFLPQLAVCLSAAFGFQRNHVTVHSYFEFYIARSEGAGVFSA